MRRNRNLNTGGPPEDPWKILDSRTGNPGLHYGRMKPGIIENAIPRRDARYCGFDTVIKANIRSNT